MIRNNEVYRSCNLELEKWVTPELPHNVNYQTFLKVTGLDLPLSISISSSPPLCRSRLLSYLDLLFFLLCSILPCLLLSSDVLEGSSLVPAVSWEEMRPDSIGRGFHPADDLIQRLLRVHSVCQQGETISNSSLLPFPLLSFSSFFFSSPPLPSPFLCFSSRIPPLHLAPPSVLPTSLLTDSRAGGEGDPELRV